MAPSSTLIEFEAWLLAAALGLTSTNLTRTAMPDEPDEVTTIYEYPGVADDPGFGAAGIQFEHPRLQVVCRGKPDDYDTPRLQLERIRQGATTIQAKTLSGTNWQMVTSLGGPIPLGKDNKGRVRLACNFQVDKSPSRTS